MDSYLNNDTSYVTKIKKRLELLIHSEESLIYNEKKILKYLNYLDTVTISISILSQSDIGSLIRKMKKSPGPIGEVATNLVKKWRLYVISNKTPSKVDVTKQDTYSSNLTSESLQAIEPSFDNVKRFSKTKLNSHKDNYISNSNKLGGKQIIELNNNKNQFQWLNNSLKQPIHQSQNENMNTICSHTPQTSSNSCLISNNKRARKDSNTIEQFCPQKSKTKVFPGRFIQLRAVSKLSTLCLRIVEINIEFLEEVGSIEYQLLKPLFEKLPWEQVDRLERLNPQFIPETDYLWKRFCKKYCYSAERTDNWKNIFFNSHHKQNQKLKSVTQSISTRINLKKPVAVAKKISIPSTHKVMKNKKTYFPRFRRSKSPLSNSSKILKIIRKQHIEAKQVKNSKPHK